MSAVERLARPHRIKAAHRWRWKCSTGHSVYANDNPYRYTDPDGRQFATLDCGDGGCFPAGTKGGSGTMMDLVAAANMAIAEGQAQGQTGSAVLTGRVRQASVPVKSARNPNDFAFGQSSAGSSQSGKVTKEWTVQDFNEFDKRATNSYAPLFLAPVVLGGGTGAVVVGGPVVWSAASPYVRPAALAACLALSCKHEPQPEQFVQQRERLVRMVEGLEGEAKNLYKEVQTDLEQ